MSEKDYAIPIVYRHHKDLWQKNRQTLDYQMAQARLLLLENEKVRVADKPIELVIGQLTVSIGSE